MPKLRRFHLSFDAPVQMTLSDRSVTFGDMTFHSKSVMLEYDVDPPLMDDPFRPTS